MQRSVSSKIINITIRSTYFIFCRRNKPWTDPELLAFSNCEQFWSNMLCKMEILKTLLLVKCRCWLAIVIEPRVDYKDVYIQIPRLFFSLIFHSLVTSYFTLPGFGYDSAIVHRWLGEVSGVEVRYSNARS